MKKQLNKLNKKTYNNVEDAVVDIFLNKQDRKRMFSVLFMLILIGVLVIATGTHFLLKQQAIIDQNEEIDWKKQHLVTGQIREETIKEESKDFKRQEFEMTQQGAELKEQSFEKVELLFLGDLMLDRYNRELIERNNSEWITEKVRKLFTESDISVANLEGPVTSNESVSLGSVEGERNNFIFTFDPEHTRKFLEGTEIKLLNLGNNHILNFGKEGLSQTKNFLLQSGFEYFGDIKDEENGVVEKELKGLKLAFISYNQFGGKGFEEVEKVIKKVEDVNDITIVYAHWGEEYELTENEEQKRKARAFIDAGADLIIGSHPHVIQPVELYKEKIIFYSLGNFVFDQYFSAETRLGLAVGVSISSINELNFVLTPLQLQKNGQLDFVADEQKNKLAERILRTKALRELISL